MPPVSSGPPTGGGIPKQDVASRVISPLLIALNEACGSSEAPLVTPFGSLDDSRFRKMSRDDSAKILPVFAKCIEQLQRGEWPKVDGASEVEQRDAQNYIVRRIQQIVFNAEGSQKLDTQAVRELFVNENFVGGRFHVCDLLLREDQRHKWAAELLNPAVVGADFDYCSSEGMLIDALVRTPKPSEGEFAVVRERLQYWLGRAPLFVANALSKSGAWERLGSQELADAISARMKDSDQVRNGRGAELKQHEKKALEKLRHQLQGAA